MAIKLNTGKKEFQLIFDDGIVEKIYFNPNDPDIAKRLSEFQGRIGEKLKALEDTKLTADGTPETIEMIEKYKQFRKSFDEEFDRAFNSNISETVFKYCSPFAIIDGDYYVVQFINGIKPEIEKHIKKATAEADKKIQKHIGKYIK